MNGDARYENRLTEADPGAYGSYISLRERDARCDACRMAGVCPVAWAGALDCPDLDHLVKGEDNGT
jgi:hypothetical protein